VVLRCGASPGDLDELGADGVIGPVGADVEVDVGIQAERDQLGDGHGLEVASEYRLDDAGDLVQGRQRLCRAW
jgi:hypothetical protein